MTFIEGESRSRNQQTDKPGDLGSSEFVREWSEIIRGLRYLKTRFPEADAVQISATGKRDFLTPDGIRVRPAIPFLAELV
jgi:hypothetical protein